MKLWQGLSLQELSPIHQAAETPGKVWQLNGWRQFKGLRKALIKLISRHLHLDLLNRILKVLNISRWKSLLMIALNLWKAFKGIEYLLMKCMGYLVALSLILIRELR